MKNLKSKLSIIMITTTIILFLITFIALNFYQNIYIFDKAISSLENEVEYFINGNDEASLLNDEQRFYQVDLMLLDEEIIENDNLDNEIFYFNKTETYFKELYKQGKIAYNQIQKVNTEFGDYYLLLKEVPEAILWQSTPYTLTENPQSEKTIPILFFVDITISNNIIHRLNIVFLIMLIIAIIVEGLVGIYLGIKFEDSQHKLEHFFQNASHELKSPLMSIQGYAEGLKSGVITDTAVASDVIINKSNKMKTLIDEILNISKLDSNEYIFKRDIVDIRDIVEDSLDNFEKITTEKNLTITLDFAETDNTIIADPLQIYKAVNTVIDNAFKFAKNKIEIKTYKNKSALILDVYNNGEQIADENLKHIFDRFYSNNDFSTGIGLAMAKEILLASKGDISVENMEDGVVFTFKLPLK